jgi:hypothetical protein
MLSKRQNNSKKATKDAIPEEVISSVISHLEDKINAQRKEKEIFTSAMKKITGGKGFTLTFSK